MRNRLPSLSTAYSLPMPTQIDRLGEQSSGGAPLEGGRVFVDGCGHERAIGAEIEELSTTKAPTRLRSASCGDLVHC